jgi:molybdate-binding protein
VKNDACDTGMAIFASAKAMGLDFIPVMWNAMIFAY